MSDYSNGAVTVGATPTLVCTAGAENDGVLLQNTGAVAVFVGGPAVTASGATTGISLAAGATLSVPSVGGLTHNVYATVASGTSTVVYLYPNV